jgi:hypothetical protein
MTTGKESEIRGKKFGSPILRLGRNREIPEF